MRIGTISTRFSGHDGVSLEAAKIAAALEPVGFQSVWFGGELDRRFQPGHVSRRAHFALEENLQLERAFFDPSSDHHALLDEIDRRADHLVAELELFLVDHNPDALLIHQAFSLPMQLPLAAALKRVLGSTQLPAVGFHHDFSWERPRFAESVAPEFLEAHFPPVLDNLAHVVINLDARDELDDRLGLDATVVPNLMDFERPPVPGDGKAFRRRAELADDDRVLLQSTRVIARKGIELTLDLAAGLEDEQVKVVVTHEDDLDADYWRLLLERAASAGVDLRMVPVDHESSLLADAYAAADLVCFPSYVEGFGNALIEAVYYRRPLFVNRYPVYVRDISPCGLRCVEIEGRVTDHALTEVGHLLDSPTVGEEWADENYGIGLEHFSYAVARDRLVPLLKP